MLINLSAQGDASLLVNEQQQSGDPKSGENGYIPTGNFFLIHNKMYYPIQLVIDLEVLHQITDLYVFDTHNKDSIKVYSGSPKNWKLQGSLYLGGYNHWKGLTLKDKTRYLMLEFSSTKANISEIVLYGKALETSSKTPTSYTHKLPLFEDLMGVNAVHNHPMDKLICFGAVREYHSWQWDEGNGNIDYPGYPNNQFGWNPSWVGGKNPWNFDKIYQGYKILGIDVSPCLQKNVPYMLQEDEKIEWKPIFQNSNAENPNSYKAHSRYMFQFAARYGSEKVPSQELMLKPDNTEKSGLSLIRYIENWNEPDKWWRGRNGYFTPFELAAMCSADYDGHEGSLGAGYGAKTADPSIKFVMGGLANLSLEYIRAMKLWSDTYRETGFPADVINFHHYSNISGGQQAKLKQAISPEDDSLKYKLREIVEYRDQHLPGKEIWLSEFGYDTNPNSPQGVQAIGEQSELEVQAQWLVRSFLEMAAAGIDRAHVYFFADLNSKNPNKFNSCGVVTEKWFKYQPKTSWYYLYCLKEILSGYRFASEITSTDPNVNVYKFEHPTNGSCIYATWCKTSSDRTIADYPLKINSTKAELLELSSDQITPTYQDLEVSKSYVKINVSEKPVFVKTPSL